MATFNPRKFTDPDWLSRISAPLLIRFLNPWRSYLAGQDFQLPEPGATKLNFAALAHTLMALAPGCPADMIDALYYVQETSTPEDMEALLMRVEASRLKIDDDPPATPADYAIQVWLADAKLIQERHAEAFAYRQQRFEYFSGRQARKRKFPIISKESGLEIERTLDAWFAAHKRGQGCRLFVFRRPPHVWLLIRHGRLMSREASHEDDGTSGTEYYRPQQHDVLIYDENTDEIGVHASIKGEFDLYLKTLGSILFGDESYFPRANKFTLTPLIEIGATALNCADIDGIDNVN